jgi:hypothetical protein
MGGQASCVQSADIDDVKPAKVSGWRSISAKGETTNSTERFYDESPGAISISPMVNDSNNSVDTSNDKIIPRVATNDTQLIMDQIFILCENGVASTLTFLLDVYPHVLRCINGTKSCNVADFQMELSPLQLCAACGHVTAVDVLLSLPNVLCNLKDKTSHMTALHFAIVLSHPLVIEALCKDARIDLSVKNMDGKTPLHLALELENLEAVEIISRLRPNADLRMRDFDGNNCMHAAAMHPNEKIMKLLVNHAAAASFYSPFQAISYQYPKNGKNLFYSAYNFKNQTARHILQIIVDSRDPCVKTRTIDEATKCLHLLDYAALYVKLEMPSPERLLISFNQTENANVSLTDLSNSNMVDGPALFQPHMSHPIHVPSSAEVEPISTGTILTYTNLPAPSRDLTATRTAGTLSSEYSLSPLSSQLLMFPTGSFTLLERDVLQKQQQLQQQLSQKHQGRGPIYSRLQYDSDEDSNSSEFSFITSNACSPVNQTLLGQSTVAEERDRKRGS